jgi:hypothetical protein
MPIIITKYACVHCAKEYKVNKNAQKHESQCYHNPATQSCVTCGDLIAQDQDHHKLIFGEDVCDNSWIPVCAERHDQTDMGAGDTASQMQTKCPFWKPRVKIGSYRFGRVFLQTEEEYGNEH